MKFPFLIILLAGHLAAATETTLLVVIGDQKTLFTTDSDSPKKIGRTQNKGKIESLEMSDRNQKFLKDEFIQIGELETNKVEHCPHNFIALSVGAKTTVGCVSSKTKVATRLAQLTNMIELAFRVGKSKEKAK